MTVAQIAIVGSKVRVSINDASFKGSYEGTVISVEQDPEFLDYEVSIMQADGKRKSLMIGDDSTDRTIEAI